MSALEIRQRLAIKTADAARYRQWADECPLPAWSAEYRQIAARYEAEARELAEKQKETAHVQ